MIESYLFEISWEVCNKVGGIYTVIKSKAKYLKKYFKNRYFLIGPYFREKVVGEFIPKSSEDFKHIFEELERIGIKVYYGEWDIPGKPNVFLIDFSDFWYTKNDFKGWLWREYKIDSIRSGFDFDEPIVWGYAVGMLLEKLYENFQSKEAIFHFHEWLSGGALLYIRKKVDKGIVFTTHATVLGRTLAQAGYNVHEMILEGIKNKETVDESLAYKFFVEAKHLTEKACALNSYFTAVSYIVGREAKYMLGKFPDAITPNGIDIREEYTVSDLLRNHEKNKRKILEFLKALLLPYTNIKISEKDKIFFISGRYEVKSKGIDLFIRSLYYFNELLKNSNVKRNVFIFFFVPTAVKGENTDVLHNIILYKKIKEDISKRFEEKLDEIVESYIRDEKVSLKKIVFDEEIERLKRFLRRNFGKNPPIITHNLSYPLKDDFIYKYLNENGLIYNRDKRMWIVIYPIYLSIHDKMLEMGYYDVVNGADLGVFPSYYEPYGYTPLECLIFTTPSITSNLAGFGRIILEYFKNKEIKGIYVIDREKDFEDSAKELGKILFRFYSMNEREYLENRVNAYNIGRRFCWENLIKRYLKAYNNSLKTEPKINKII